jgi:hypothetical protein
VAALPLAAVQTSAVLAGPVPRGTSLTGQLVFRIKAYETFDALVFAGTRENKALNIAGGTTIIRAAVPTPMPASISPSPSPEAPPLPTATPVASRQQSTAPGDVRAKQAGAA